MFISDVFLIFLNTVANLVFEVIENIFVRDSSEENQNVIRVYLTENSHEIKRVRGG